MQSWQINGQNMVYSNWAEHQPDLKNRITIGRNSFNHKVFYRIGYNMETDSDRQITLPAE